MQGKHKTQWPSEGVRDVSGRRRPAVTFYRGTEKAIPGRLRLSYLDVLGSWEDQGPSGLASRSGELSLRGPQPRLAGASPAATPTVPKHPAERRSRLRMLRSGKVPRRTRRVPHAGGGTQGGPRIRTMGTCGGPTALRTKFPPEERGLLRTHSWSCSEETRQSLKFRSIKGLQQVAPRTRTLVYVAFRTEWLQGPIQVWTYWSRLIQRTHMASSSEDST